MTDPEGPAPSGAEPAEHKRMTRLGLLRRGAVAGAAAATAGSLVTISAGEAEAAPPPLQFFTQWEFDYVTAMAETAYYRLVFLEGTTADLSPLTVELSAFQVDVRTRAAVDLLRPPFSSEPDAVSAADLTAIRRAGRYRVVLADVDTEDWRRPGVSAITHNILTFTQNGSIILMHDGGGDRSQTVTALTTIIEQLLARGFTFVTIPELLRHLPPAPITQQP